MKFDIVGGKNEQEKVMHVMKRMTGVCAALALATGVAMAQQDAAKATITVHADRPLHPLSPTLYGLMTEEINYSYDGGLYPELVRNRAFMETSFMGLEHWFAVEKGDASLTFAVDRTTGPSAALARSLKLTVTQASPTAQAGVLNEGYWGMTTGPNMEYKGSFYAKTDTAEMGPVTVSLVNNQTGAVVATASVGGIGTEWSQHAFTLKAGAKTAVTADNHLEVTVGHAGTLWLELVSLMPPTYKDRANGLRPDLMELLAGMQPKFLRFPGGNYLEGDHIWERFDWKTTIGPAVDRPTHRSPWDYQSSDGMGLLEFLGWCEDLHMEPVLAVYAGYSLKGEHIEPGPALEPFVQDAMDELEYVTGDATTKWGAIRARDGHPAPFKVRYIEIGNEDEFDRSGSYGGRYKQFYTALKAKYPDATMIATTPVKTMKPDMIDDHYYKRVDEMLSIVHKYDDADRSGPKIFVGEWATREGGPTTNLGAALADAAWMTGLERNSDLILIASYAPLLVNVNPGGMQWESNLIGYNALTSYGSPSYYAQAMFASHMAADVPASEATGLPQRVFYSVNSDKAAGKVIVKLVNVSSVPQPVELAIEGAGEAGTLTVETLKGGDMTATNTITEPKNIVPVTAKAVKVKSHLEHTVPAYAVQVLTFELK